MLSPFLSLHSEQAQAGEKSPHPSPSWQSSSSITQWTEQHFEPVSALPLFGMHDQM
jgi:hypothetical protein